MNDRTGEVRVWTIAAIGATLLVVVATACGGGSGNASTDATPVTNTGGRDAGPLPKDAVSGGGGMGGGGTMGAGDMGTAGTSGAGSSGTTGSSDPYASARQACVDKINALRATEGKAPYQRWTEAESCTDGEAESDSGTKTAHGAFGTCKESAQDECPGWPNDPNKIVTGCLQDMWDEGPGDYADHGHYINMSSTKYKSVACGFFLTADKKLWAVQNFK